LSFQWFAPGTFYAGRGLLGMKPITNTILGAAIAGFMFTGAAMAGRTPERPLPMAQSDSAGAASGQLVVLEAQPGTQSDQIARRLMARELADARRFGETPLVLVGSARLGAAHDGDVLFVQIQSARECGSAGCTIVSFRLANKKWTRILDTVGGTIRVTTTLHHGMRDLIMQDSDRLVWDGQRYAEMPLLPRTG
jgi:hypothetical protein